MINVDRILFSEDFRIVNYNMVSRILGDFFVRLFDKNLLQYY